MAKSADTKLSRSMSYFLRHGAHEAGIHLSSDGFAFVEDLLKQDRLQGYSEADVVRVVETNDKQRFKLQVDEQTKKLKVRANQGHTIKVPDLELSEVKSPDEYPIVLHGTSFRAWSSISKQTNTVVDFETESQTSCYRYVDEQVARGLSRMKRTHIHFAIGEPGDGEVISGMRSNCEVLIYIDLAKAMADDLKFYVSANKVVLCAGDDKGFLLPTYFRGAYQRHPRLRLL